MSYPTDYKYTKEHEWIKADGNNATIGITHHAQESLATSSLSNCPRSVPRLLPAKPSVQWNLLRRSRICMLPFPER